LQDVPEGTFRERVLDKLWLVGRLLHQSPKSQGKIYALHEFALNKVFRPL
jgi:IS5 family transposase